MSKKIKVIEKLKDDPLMPLRHSAEHVLHMSLESLYPGLKKVMGPPIENGFYCDFDFEGRISEDELPKIEARMQEIIDAKLPIERKEVSIEEAKDIFKDNPYKLEFISEFSQESDKVSLYVFGKEGEEFYDLDLCAGPHINNTGDIKAFKLLSTAGAYWRGDEKNKMLTRIYGTAFNNKEDLEQHLNNLEEMKKRDHRKIGKDLDLFTFADEVGPGLVLWTPKGTIIREELEKWGKETEEKWGYKRVSTPHIAKHTLYEISGHLPYYKDDMYSPMIIDEEEYYLKGMNCPHHHMIYKSTIKSYRDLPLKFAEYGTVYRYENSGALFGLMRVRSICQNDAHIYCEIDQAEEEFYQTLLMHEYYYKSLGLNKDDYFIVLGLPDEGKRDKYHGDKALWDKAQAMMMKAIERTGIRTVDDIGGAAFYGPKVDFNIKSAVGKEYSISTVQLDLYMPIRFNLTYIDRDGSEKLCAVIHRAPLGSHERFVGFLIEHFGGAFPVWLSPVQVQIIPIGEKHIEYANKVKAIMQEKGIRSEIDDKNGTMQSKIRDAQMQKIPYMLIIGDKEVESGSVSIRLRSGENLGAKPIEEASDHIKEIYLTRSLNLW